VNSSTIFGQIHPNFHKLLTNGALLLELVRHRAYVCFEVQIPRLSRIFTNAFYFSVGLEITGTSRLQPQVSHVLARHSSQGSFCGNYGTLLGCTAVARVPCDTRANSDKTSLTIQRLATDLHLFRGYAK